MYKLSIQNKIFLDMKYFQQRNPTLQTKDFCLRHFEIRFVPILRKT
jgi:hypothetical protein